MFIPSLVLNELCELTPELLSRLGKSGVLTDIDDTLCSRKNHLPGEDIKAWVKTLKDAGIPILAISNNHAKRVAAFCEPLDIPYIANAFKPFPFALLKALKILGLHRDQVIFLGDQIFTDVLGSYFAGIYSVALRPGKYDVSDCFTRTKRGLENKVWQKYDKLSKQGKRPL